MKRTLAAVVAACLLPAAAPAATPAQLCESAKLGAASKFSACRMKADSVYAKSAQAAADQAKRDGAYTKCDDKLVKAYGFAENRWGGDCPKVGDVQDVRGFLSDGGDRVREGTPFSLLKTGQTTSYGAGSDGAIEAGAAQSFTDNGNGTVTDNRTGLVWAKKSDDGSIHDKDNTYTWGQTVSPYSMNGTMVTTYLAALNAGSGFAGYTDWRIPNLEELESIRNLETYGPATFAAFNTSCTAGCTVTNCSCTVSSDYWSSSTNRSFPGSAWSVYFYLGYDFSGLKTSSYYARAVRGGS